MAYIPNPDRKLANLPKLLELYNVKKINIGYHDRENPKAYIEIPSNVDLFMMLKVWIAYDTRLKQVYVSKNLIGTGNFWLTQLLDDEKNKRLDIEKYLYE